MKPQSKLAWLFGTLMLGAVAFTGCQEEEKTTYQDVVELAAVTSDNNNAEQESDFVNGLSNIALEDYGDVSKTQVQVTRFRTIPSGATVTWSDEGGVYTRTIDFGTTGITCYDGKTRRGKIITTATGRYRESGTVITTTTENYAVSRNGSTYISHTFSRTVTNTGENEADNLVFTVVETDALVNEDGQQVNWSSNREREWSYGADEDPLTNDDTYSITGTGTAERVGVRTIDYTITSPLIFKFNCGVVYGGVLLIEDRESGNNIVVDYGSGCTAAKTVTYNINGNSYTLFL